MTPTPLRRPSTRSSTRLSTRLSTRRSVRLSALVAAAALAAVGAAGAIGAAAPAQADGAAQIYRYWAYFHAEAGDYVPSEVGLAEFVPQDGAVEALRYAAPADFTAPNLPRADLGEVTFDTVCAEEEAGEGEKRVAVLLDYGVEADSEGAQVPEPVAACAVVPEPANALQAVQAVAEVRTDEGGLLCAVDGYPASGCGGTVDSATPADEGTVDFAVAGQGGAEGGDDAAGDPSSEPADGVGAWVYALLALLLVGLVAGGVALRARRSRQGD